MKADNFKELAESRIKFDKHVYQNLIYPEATSFQKRFNDIPIKISILKNGKLENANQEEQIWVINLIYSLTKKGLYINEALKVIHSFNEWVPNKVDETHQQTKKTVVIPFHYHRKALKFSNIILNPDIRPVCLDNSWRYSATIKGDRGCDGTGRILAIISEKGMPEDIEVYAINGKTNESIIKRNFEALGKWRPAEKDGQKVKSQVNFQIYV